MFILDLYRFCESSPSFDRQQLAKFIYTHRESDRLARASGIDRRAFASSTSKEFIARHCSCGYLDLNRGVVSCRGQDRRPFGFEFYTLEGESHPYIHMQNNIGEMTDEEIFGK